MPKPGQPESIVEIDQSSLHPEWSRVLPELRVEKTLTIPTPPKGLGALKEGALRRHDRRGIKLFPELAIDPEKTWNRVVAQLLTGENNLDRDFPEDPKQLKFWQPTYTGPGSKKDRTAIRLSQIVGFFNGFEGSQDYSEVLGAKTKEAGRVVLGRTMQQIQDEIDQGGALRATHAYDLRKQYLREKLELLRRVYVMLEGGDANLMIQGEEKISCLALSKTTFKEAQLNLWGAQTFWNQFATEVCDPKIGAGSEFSIVPAIIARLNKTFSALFSSESSFKPTDLQIFLDTGAYEIDQVLKGLSPTSPAAKNQRIIFAAIKTYLKEGAHPLINHVLPELKSKASFQAAQSLRVDRQLAVLDRELAQTATQAVSNVLSSINNPHFGVGGVSEAYRSSMAELDRLIDTAQERQSSHWLHAVLEATMDLVPRAIENLRDTSEVAGRESAREKAMLDFLEHVFTLTHDSFLAHEIQPKQMSQFLSRYARWQADEVIGHLGRAASSRQDGLTYAQRLRADLEARVLEMSSSDHLNYLSGALSSEVDSTLQQLVKAKDFDRAFRLMEDIFLLFSRDSAFLQTQEARAEAGEGARPGRISVSGAQRALAEFVLHSDAAHYLLGERHSHSASMSPDFAQLLNILSELVLQKELAVPIAVVAKYGGADGQNQLDEASLVLDGQEITRAGNQARIAYVSNIETLGRRVATPVKREEDEDDEQYSEKVLAIRTDQIGATFAQLETISAPTLLETLAEFGLDAQGVMGEAVKWDRTGGEATDAQRDYDRLTSEGEIPFAPHEAEEYVARKHGRRALSLISNRAAPEKLRLGNSAQVFVRAIGAGRKFDKVRPNGHVGGLVVRRVASDHPQEIPDVVKSALQDFDTNAQVAIKATMRQWFEPNTGYLSLRMLTHTDATVQELSRLHLLYASNLFRANREHVDMNSHRDRFVLCLVELLTNDKTPEDLLKLLEYILQTKVREYYSLEQRLEIVKQVERYIQTGRRDKFVKSRLRNIMNGLGYRGDTESQLSTAKTTTVVVDMRDPLLDFALGLPENWVGAEGAGAQRSLIADALRMPVVYRRSLSLEALQQELSQAGIEVDPESVLLTVNAIAAIYANGSKDKRRLRASMVDQIRAELLLVARTADNKPVVPVDIEKAMDLAQSRLAGLVQEAELGLVKGVEAYLDFVTKQSGALGSRLFEALNKIQTLSGDQKDKLLKEIEKELGALRKERKGDVAIEQLAKDSVVSVPVLTGNPHSVVDQFIKTWQGLTDQSQVVEILTKLVSEAPQIALQKSGATSSEGQASAPASLVALGLDVDGFSRLILALQENRSLAQSSAGVMKGLIADTALSRSQIEGMLKNSEYPDAQIQQATELYLLLQTMVINSLSGQKANLQAFSAVSKMAADAKSQSLAELTNLALRFDASRLQALGVTQNHWETAVETLSSQMQTLGQRLELTTQGALSDYSRIVEQRDRVETAVVKRELGKVVDYADWLLAHSDPNNAIVRVALKLQQTLNAAGLPVALESLVPGPQEILALNPSAIPRPRRSRQKTQVVGE